MKPHYTTLLAAGLIATCVLFLLWPILSTGQWYKAEQAYRYPFLMDLFKASFLSGHLYPRWLPELMGGYGYPTFLYYPPGFWFAALPYALLFDTVTAMHLATITIFTIGCTGTYRLGRHFALPPLYAAAGAIIFLTTPYIILQLYVRGSLAELQGLMLGSWVVLRYLQLYEAARRNQPLTKPIIHLALILAALIYTHPFVSFWMAVALASMAIVDVTDPRHHTTTIARALAGLVLAGIIALALSTPYWVNLVLLKNAVSQGWSLEVGHFLQPLSGLFNIGNIEWPIHPARVYLLNPYTYTLALAGLILSWKKAHARAALLVCGFMLFMMTFYSDHLWNEFAPLSYTQMSSRIISALAAFQLIGIILALHWLRQKMVSVRYHAALWIGLVLIGIAPIIPGIKTEGAMHYAAYRERQLSRFTDMTHTREFMPVHAKTTGLSPRRAQNIPVLETINGTTIPLNTVRDDDITFATTRPTQVTINQFWFPGWRARDKNGKAHSIDYDINGRMVISVESDARQTIRVWYDGPPYWQIRNLTALCILLLCAYTLHRWKKRQTGGNHSA